MARSLDPATSVGPVRLTVADLDRARAFYERAIGLREVGQAQDGVVALGADAGVPLVELAGRPGAPARAPRRTGLYHLALLVPDRAELARALRRVIDAGHTFDGASDHLVSEALYLSDPEGNGIEIYRDRPREEWQHVDGELQMATLALDLRSLVAELPEGDDPGMPSGTRMGHVHLQVGDLDAAERFYHGVLGFDVVVRGYPGALFVSAGGYHHHIGLNTWAGAGAPAPPPGARGLDRFTVDLAGREELERVAQRVRDAGLSLEDGGDGLLTTDPSGNRVLLRAAAV